MAMIPTILNSAYNEVIGETECAGIRFRHCNEIRVGDTFLVMTQFILDKNSF